MRNNISSKDVIVAIIILASISLAYRIISSSSNEQYPTILEYLQCLNKKCSTQECEFKDYECELAFSEYKKCQKSSQECQEWEQEIQKDIQDIKISESFFKCKKSCKPNKDTSGAFFMIYKCDEFCAISGMNDDNF